MCTILFAYDCHPCYQLVVAANRDEFFSRPARAAEFWTEAPNILGGRDLQEGGTWMGITTEGRFATLTNYRDPSSYKQEAPSRGQLVQNYLCGQLSPESYIETLENGGTAYNGFNLLLGTYESMYYYSNRGKNICKVEKGVHGMSNSLLDVPWPKVSKGIKAVGDVVEHKEIEVEQLFAIMADREQPDERNLPQTGVSLEMEKMLAPMYVMSPHYGTRTTTVLLVDRKHRVQFWERTFAAMNPDKWNEIHYTFEGIACSS
ncbi:MAG: NRDE family protein [Bacillota bacterium]|nr:NRDE family protein [Bacillota bacterium]